MDNAESEKSYNGLERFIYIIVLPVLFMLVLTGVLLALFDYDVKGILYSVGKKIPVVSNLVPEEEGLAGEPGSGGSPQQGGQNGVGGEEAGDERDDVIASLAQDVQQRDDQIKVLEDSVEKLLLEQEAAVLSTEEYRKQLRDLAAMYANMTASRAAPILENLTMPELVLVLYEMESESRGRLLERMNPKTAADASIQLKDISDSNRSVWEEAARAAREERTMADDPDSIQRLTSEQLAQTFAAMTPTSAATILLELNKTNSAKVVAILKAMDNQSRSSLMMALGEQSPQSAASLADQLG